MSRRLFTFIWNLSERTGIGLGRFAPFVFERMIGSKGVRVWHEEESPDA